MSDPANSEAQAHVSSNVAHVDGGRDRRKTTSALLLHRAVTILGAEAVAPALGLTTAELECLDAVDKPMNLEQQRTLALAVLVLSDGQPELRRRAIALLAQIRAAVQFAMGATECHSQPPSTNRWPERI